MPIGCYINRPKLRHCYVIVTLLTQCWLKSTHTLYVLLYYLYTVHYTLYMYYLNNVILIMYSFQSLHIVPSNHLWRPAVLAGSNCGTWYELFPRNHLWRCRKQISVVVRKNLRETINFRFIDTLRSLSAYWHSGLLIRSRILSIKIVE